MEETCIVTWREIAEQNKIVFFHIKHFYSLIEVKERTSQQHYREYNNTHNTFVMMSVITIKVTVHQWMLFADVFRLLGQCSTHDLHFMRQKHPHEMSNCIKCLSLWRYPTCTHQQAYTAQDPLHSGASGRWNTVTAMGRVLHSPLARHKYLSRTIQKMKM